MDLERCYAKSSSCSSSSSSAAADRMVRIELEAAEALADLAHLAMRESGAESTAKWGSKGKRVRKRLKTESPPSDSPLNLVDSEPRCSDLAEDRAVVDKQQGQQMCGDIITKPVKAEQDAESLKTSPMCSRRYTSMGGGRSRQNLTEAEKEARRLRRVLANRESARQTIRRRQALCEELTRKAAELAQENENLMREKELALQEYQSLETTNKHLKEQMTRVIKAKEKETPAELKSAHADISTSPSMNSPLLLYNQHHFSQLCWPSLIQSSNSVQSHGPQNAILLPSIIPTLANGKHDSSQEQVNPLNINEPRTPLYIVSCPWFFPLPDHRNGLHPQPSFGLKDIQDETSVNNLCRASSSSKTVAHVENQHFSLPIEVKKEPSGLAEARHTNDLNENPVGFPPDEGGQHIGPHPKEILTPASLSSAGPTFAVKHETLLHSIYSQDIEAISTKASQIVSALPEKNQELVNFPSTKLADSVAAAEARRRRKELTKLKNLHGRQCRMHC